MPGAWIVPSCRMTSAPLRTGSTAPRKLKRSGSSDRTLSPLTSSLASRRTSSLSSPQKMRTSSESTALMAPRSSPAARLCSATAAKAPDCRFGGREVAFERFQVVGRNCLLEGRQPQLLRLSEQSCAISRVAELPRENSGFLEPEGAAPEIGRQPSASFQGCRGDCVRATELRAFGGASSRRATSSSGPAEAPAACQAARSGSSARVSARAACARRRSSADAVCSTAERTSGCRKRKPSEASAPSPAAPTGSHASGRIAFPRSLSAAAVSRSGSASSSAATRRSARASASRFPSLEANARSSRAVSGNASNPDDGSSLSPLAAIGSSVSASGFPAAASRTLASRPLRASPSCRSLLRRGQRALRHGQRVPRRSRTAAPAPRPARAVTAVEDRAR